VIHLPHLTRKARLCVTWWAVLWYMRGSADFGQHITWLFRASSLVRALRFLAYLSCGGTHPWQFEDLALFSIFWLPGAAQR
jgi:hypothetical protein